MQRMELWEKYAIARIEISGGGFYGYIRTSIIILLVGIQLRPGKLFSRRTPTNKLPVSYKYPQTFVRAGPVSPVSQIKIVVYKLTKISTTFTFKYLKMFLVLSGPIYLQYLLETLKKYISNLNSGNFVWVLSFINKFLNFEIGNTEFSPTHPRSNQSSKISL